MNAKIEFSDVSLSLFRGFPALNLQIDDLHLVGIDDFENDTLIKFNFLSTNLNLKSVVFGDQIKINSIILDQPDIYVKVLKNGKANYDIVKPDSTETEEPEPDDDAEEGDGAFAVALKKLQIRDANIIYDDQESDLLASIENLNFNLKGDLTEKLTSLELLLEIDSLSVRAEGVTYIDRAKLSFDSEIEANMEKSIYTFMDNVFIINKLQLGFDGFVEMPEDDINMDIKFSATKTEFKHVLSMIPAVYLKDFEDVETKGKFTFSGFAKGIYNDNSIPSFGIDLLVENAWFQYPDLPQAVDNINIDIHVENPGDENINIVDIRKFHLEMAKNPVDVKLKIKTSANDVYMNGNIKATLNMSTINQFYPLDGMTLSGAFSTNVNFKGNLSAIENEEYDKFDANGNLLITNMKTTLDDLPPITISKTDLIFSPQKAVLKQFKAQIGKSDIMLDGTIDNIFSYVFSDKAIKARFNLKAKLFDANDFLSYDQSEDDVNEATPEESVEGEITAFEIPENINLTLSTNIDKVLFEKLEIKNIIGSITLKNSILSLDELKMNLLKGSMQLSGSYDAHDYKNPFADLSFSMNNIDLVETYSSFVIIPKLVPIVKSCSGQISTSFHIDTYLDYNLNPVYNTLNGSGSFSSNYVAIKQNKLFGILATLTKKDEYKNPSVRDIDIGFLINDGNIEILPTKLMIANSQASIQGVSNLDKSIDFQLGLTVAKSTAGNLVNNLPLINLPNDIEIYANIGGTIDDPKIDKFSTNVFDNTKDELSEAALKYIAEAQKRADKLVADAKAVKTKLVKEANNKVNQLTNTAKSEANKLLEKAKEEGDALIAKANNPIAKELAKKAAKKLLVIAQKAANNKINKVKQQVKNLVKDAEKEGDKKIKDAEKEGDKIVKEAEKKAKDM